ncbi:hypothetical protein CEXT_563021 [Caerostris extrusa]|uniref:Ycf15 n=1 Tax=Caerostris extrusa TaxID=172846 RepID=A0AAV4XZF7_CAEEX|nr:hypothetical protein CEXT_563021 [Caerostris extrusa]
MDPILLGGWDEAEVEGITWSRMKCINWNKENRKKDFYTERNSPEKSSAFSGGTQRPVERKIYNRSEPIKGISLSVKARIRSRYKMLFYSRQSGSYGLSGSLTCLLLAEKG